MVVAWSLRWLGAWGWGFVHRVRDWSEIGCGS